MTPQTLRAYFTGADGGYRFARWTGPIRAAVFGEGAVTPAVLAEALGRVGALTGHPGGLVTDGAMTWGLGLVRDWPDLLDLPGLGRLMPDVARFAAEAERRGWNQFRRFSHDGAGGITGCIGLVRLAGPLGALAPETLALRQAALVRLSWSVPHLLQVGLAEAAPGGGDRLRPEIETVLAAAYDAAVPPASTDPAHADRLAAVARAQAARRAC